MKKFIRVLLIGSLFHSVAVAKMGSPAPASLVFREISYDGALSESEARFTLSVNAEANGESSAPLLEGDVAVLPASLPDALSLVREGNRYVLVARRSGHFKFQLAVVAKIQRAEPWNRISFTGPAAAIASVTAEAAGADTEIQLLNGTPLESANTNGVARVKGFLGADRTVALRWQARAKAVAHLALVTVDSTLTAHVTPAVIKYTSRFRCNLIQGTVAQLAFALPASQTLTKLEGEQIRDWHLADDSNGVQILTIEFLKPLENSCDLTIYSEQTAASFLTPDGREGVPGTGGGNTTPIAASLNPPQPLNVERESGSFTISAEDALVEIIPPAGLRRVNAPDNAVAAYQLNTRPLALPVKLKPIEPVITVADRVQAQLEEARLVIRHLLTLDVEKAGIYTAELRPPAGFTVAGVCGEGIEDWNVRGGKICVNFSARLLGSRRVEVQLEQPLKSFPDQITLSPLRLAGAEKETAQIGAAAAPGIQLRTGALSGVREIPVSRLSDRSDAILAYTAERPDWRITIASEKLAARVVADVFNLVTIGDGIVGGSATIRYGLVNQGVQSFQVRVPAGFQNVEFTGPNLRSQTQAGEVWTIGLQDKAWGGYTLVVTYDYQFDAQGAALPIGGIHAVGVERETGSIAVTTAASLQLRPKAAGDTLRRIDETELPAADRSLITRAVALACQYTGDQYELTVEARRFAEVPVLEAVADRTQITSVLTAAGEMLTQATFMVKNNEKQFQRFQLPPRAKLWGCYVNGQPVKPGRDGDWVLVSLPRGADRDRAFAVDITYAQTSGPLTSTWGKSLQLRAPRTDVPNTYAEWQLYVPRTFRLSDFGGSMNVAQGTTYGLWDAWGKFLAFYGQVLREAGGAILIIGLLALLVLTLVISSARRGWSGVLTLLAVMAILAVLSAMLLPALARAKAKAQRISSVNNLKQIGLAAQVFAEENNHRLPLSFDEMKNELNTDKITCDPETGQRYTYLGGGRPLDELQPDSVLAFSPMVNGHCEVLYADGSVEQMSDAKFAQLSQRGLVQLATPQQIAERRQRAVVARNQFVNPPAASAPAAGRATVNPGIAAGVSGAMPQTATTAATPAAGPVNHPPIETPAPPMAAPTIAGLRSLRIELPQTGQPFLFTKVLNVRDEPLSIRARILPLQTFQTIQMAWQTAAFLLGLAVWWWQWRRAHRHTFVLTVALALILGSVGSLLVQWRALHDALIVGFPAVALAVISFLVWKFWPRGRQPEATEPPSAEPYSPETGLPPVPPVAAAIVLLAWLGLSSSHAAPPESAPRHSAGMTEPDGWTPTASLVSANYSGTINDRVAMLEATLQFASVQTGQSVRLFGDDVAVQQFTVKDGRAELIRGHNGLAVKFGRRGGAKLEIKLLVKIAGDVTKRRLVFGIPSALSSQTAFTLEEPEVDVDFPAAIAFRRILETGRTRVEAVLGPADHVELAWTPRVKRADEVAATVFCRNASLVTLGNGIVNVRATLAYQITQGELRQARVRLPAGQRLLRVDGKEIRAWEIKTEPLTRSLPPPDGEKVSDRTGEGPVLVVDLLKGVRASWQLTVETEKLLDGLPVTESIAVPRALDVKRETGLIALSSAEELGLSVESATGLQRVDAEEFNGADAPPASSAGQKPTGGTPMPLFSVFQFSQPEFTLRVRAAAIQPEVEAVVQNHFRVGAGQISLSAEIDYQIKRAGIFALKIALPAGYRVESVTGNGIQQQVERADGDARALEITLKDRTSGDYRMGLELRRDLKELPKSLALAGVHPLGAAKLTGYVAVSAEPGVAVKAGSFDGLTEIPASALPDSDRFRRPPAPAGGVLAYKYVAPEPETAPAWSLAVTTGTVAAWVHAEIVNTFQLSETLINGRALVRYDIANAPVKAFQLNVPAEFKNVEIAGPNIRSRERNGHVWRVELQSPTRGSYTLTVTWDEPRVSETNALALTGIAAEGVERETGLLAVSAKAPLQVSESVATDLQRVDTSDFPDWAGRPDPATALAYRYVRPGYRLTLDVRRFGEAEVLQALVDHASFTSVVADDGQMMTKMSLALRSHGRQFLEVGLPAGARVWSAFVAGQPVHPSRRDGNLLLPIQQAGVNDGALSVELIYVGTNSFPRTRGPVKLVSPKFDVPVKNARWEIYLPLDYTYRDFAGTMTREATGAPAWISRSFSSLEYSRMELAGKTSAQVEIQRDLSEAERQLASGDVRGANAIFRRAKAQAYAARDGSDGFQKLEKTLQSAAASNLIKAQKDFTLRNADRLGASENLPTQPPEPGVPYENAAAERQWARLQQAQELTASRVQPLRVNLPVRGLGFAFTQVLQTKAGRPMTIQLWAASEKAVHWPSRIFAATFAFLILWAMVAAMLKLAARRT